MRWSCHVRWSKAQRHRKKRSPATSTAKTISFRCDTIPGHIRLSDYMSSAKQVISNSFESSAADRLARFINQQGTASRDVVALTPDASTRKYYRIGWKKRTAIAAVYAEPFDPEFHPYLDVTRLFLDCDIPVPEIYAVDGAEGIIVQEDLGDRQLYQVYAEESEEQCDQYKEEAIALIAKIQNATARAYETQSIASRLAFDEAKLSWQFFDNSQITFARVAAVHQLQQAITSDLDWNMRAFDELWQTSIRLNEIVAVALWMWRSETNAIQSFDFMYGFEQLNESGFAIHFWNIAFAVTGDDLTEQGDLFDAAPD